MMSDKQREEEIDRMSLELQFAKTPAKRRAAWERMQALIKQRSPEQVKRMERAAGLDGSLAPSPLGFEKRGGDRRASPFHHPAYHTTATMAAGPPTNPARG